MAEREQAWAQAQVLAQAQVQVQVLAQVQVQVQDQVQVQVQVQDQVQAQDQVQDQVQAQAQELARDPAQVLAAALRWSPSNHRLRCCRRRKQRASCSPQGPASAIAASQTSRRWVASVLLRGGQQLPRRALCT